MIDESYRKLFKKIRTLDGYSTNEIYFKYTINSGTIRRIMKKDIYNPAESTIDRLKRLKEDYESGELEKYLKERAETKSNENIKKDKDWFEKLENTLKKENDKWKAKDITKKDFGLKLGQTYKLINNQADKRNNFVECGKLVAEYKRFFIFDTGKFRVAINKNDVVCEDYEIMTVG